MNLSSSLLFDRFYILYQYFIRFYLISSILVFNELNTVCLIETTIFLFIECMIYTCINNSNVADLRRKIIRLYVIVISLFISFGNTLLYSICLSLITSCLMTIHTSKMHLLLLWLSTLTYLLDWNDKYIKYPYPTLVGLFVGSLFDMYIERDVRQVK